MSLYQNLGEMMRFISLLFLTSSLLFSAVISADDAEKQKAVYLPLNPSLIANVQGTARYARCDVQLLVNSEDNIADVRLHAPAIRHELLLLLGDQKGDVLMTPQGKEKFRQSALAAVGKVIKEQTGVNSIKDLFFTSFFVQ
jgi:flagellar protein FliL